jgi:hypothetical protein
MAVVHTDRQRLTTRTPGLAMALSPSSPSQQTTGLTDLPRAVLSAAVGMIDTVERAMVGEAKVRTSRGNAWEAVLADRARASRRDEVRRRVATLSSSGAGPLS